MSFYGGKRWLFTVKSYSNCARSVDENKPLDHWTMNVSDIPMDVYLRNGELMFWFWHTKSNQLGCLGHAMVIVCLSHFVFKSTEDVGATLRLVAVGPSLSMMSLHNVHKRKSEQVPQNHSLYWLVVSNMTFIFHFIWDVILPIDELHHFSRWVGQPPTR